MLKILSKYQKTIAFRVDKPLEIVYREVCQFTNPHTLEKNYIQILVKPTSFDPFAGRGFINLTLSEIDNGNNTFIRCEIMPISITKKGVYVILFVLSIWTLFGLSISYDFNSFLTIAFGWIMLIGVMHFVQILSKGKLENYIRFILSRLKAVDTTFKDSNSF